MFKITIETLNGKTLELVLNNEKILGHFEKSLKDIKTIIITNTKTKKTSIKSFSKFGAISGLHNIF